MSANSTIFRLKCRQIAVIALVNLGNVAWASSSDVKLPPNGPTLKDPHPKVDPIRLNAEGDWIFIKLFRPNYEPLAASKNGVVLMREITGNRSLVRWKAADQLLLDPEMSQTRSADITSMDASRGTHIFNSYAINPQGVIALGYTYSSVTTAGSVWDQYIRVWDPSETQAKLVQGELSQIIAYDGGGQSLNSMLVTRNAQLLAVSNRGTNIDNFITGNFSRRPKSPIDPTPWVSSHRLKAQSRPLDLPRAGANLDSWFGRDLTLTGLNSAGQHIGYRTGDYDRTTSGVVEFQNVDFAPAFMSENGIALGREGLQNFNAPSFLDGAKVMYSDSLRKRLPLPSDGIITWVDELDRPNGFSPEGVPVVWTPRKDQTGHTNYTLGYDRENYIPLPIPEGWVTNPTHLIPPHSIKPQLGILIKGDVTQPFLAIRGGLYVDSNRDGTISFDGSDKTSISQPFRFWINDDDDSGDEANQSVLGGNSDEPGKLSGWLEFDGRTPDHAHTGVDGRCDLLDFFPVYLDIRQLLTVLPANTAGIEYKLKQADAAFNFVYTDLSRDHAFAYLTKEEAIYGTNLNKLPSLAETNTINSKGITLNPIFLEKIKNGNEKGIILLEGVKPSDQPLILEVFKDKQSIAQVQIYIKINEVEKMYRWINLRKVAGQTENRPTNINEPANYPDNTTNGKMFIWVHGYNVNEQQSRAWNAEVFKRLYQSGSRAMFTAVSWHGDHSQVPLIGVSPNYWQNITYAFMTAPALSAASNPLPGSSKIIAGHSMGNVVVSSAIKDYGLNASKYFMLNAAVAMEAYDTDAMSIDAMRHPDWAIYDSHLWSTEWHKLFPSESRAGLTWRDRFGDIPNATNFYSSGEDVLNNNDDPSGGTPGRVPAVGSERSWVLQEMVKGTKHIGAVLTLDSQGGWGLNEMWKIAVTSTTSGPHGSTTTTYRPRTSAEANTLTADELKIEPFFRRFKNIEILGTTGSTAASQYLVRADVLGTAIPALSFAVGRNPIPSFELQHRNIDLVSLQDGWPKARLDDPEKRISNTVGRWFHSDIKNIAYRYNHQLWENWVQQGLLR